MVTVWHSWITIWYWEFMIAMAAARSPCILGAYGWTGCCMITMHLGNLWLDWLLHDHHAFWEVMTGMVDNWRFVVAEIHACLRRALRQRKDTGLGKNGELGGKNRGRT